MNHRRETVLYINVYAVYTLAPKQQNKNTCNERGNVMHILNYISGNVTNANVRCMLIPMHIAIYNFLLKPQTDFSFIDVEAYKLLP